MGLLNGYKNKVLFMLLNFIKLNTCNNECKWLIWKWVNNKTIKFTTKIRICTLSMKENKSKVEIGTGKILIFTGVGRNFLFKLK